MSEQEWAEFEKSIEGLTDEAREDALTKKLLELVRDRESSFSRDLFPLRGISAESLTDYFLAVKEGKTDETDS